MSISSGDLLGAGKAPRRSGVFEECFLRWRGQVSVDRDLPLLLDRDSAQADRGLAELFGESSPGTERLLSVFMRSRYSLENSYLRRVSPKTVDLGGTLVVEQTEQGCFRLRLIASDRGPIIVCPLHFVTPNPLGREGRRQFLLSLLRAAELLGAARCLVLGHCGSRHELSLLGFSFSDPATGARLKAALQLLMDRFRLGAVPQVSTAREFGRLELVGRIPSAFASYVEEVLRKAGHTPEESLVRSHASQLGRILFSTGGPWWGKIDRENGGGFSPRHRIPSIPRPAGRPKKATDPVADLKKMEARLQTLLESALSPFINPLKRACRDPEPIDCLDLAMALQQSVPFQRRIEAVASSFRLMPRMISEEHLAPVRKILARWNILRHQCAEFLRMVPLGVRYHPQRGWL